MDGLVKHIVTVLREIMLEDEGLLMHPLQLACVFASLICYAIAFQLLLGVPEFDSLVRVGHSKKRNPTLMGVYELLGAFIWAVWIGLRLGFHMADLYLQRRSDRFWARLCIIGLGVPGNVVFPVCAAMLAELLKGKQGVKVCTLLLVCTFFIDLIFLDHRDLGLTDMFQVVHLAALYLIAGKSFPKMFLVAALCYGRLVLIFLLKELIQWYRRIEEEAARAAEEAVQRAEVAVVLVPKAEVTAREDAVQHAEEAMVTVPKAEVEAEAPPVVEDAVQGAEHAMVLVHEVEVPVDQDVDDMAEDAEDRDEHLARAVANMRMELQVLVETIQEFAQGFAQDCDSFLMIENGEPGYLIENITERLQILKYRQEVARSVLNQQLN